MSDLESRCLDAFPQWLTALADDARSLCELVGDQRLPLAAREQLAGALSYLLKSVDLIQDGIEDLGYVDDALVLRVAALEASRLGDGATGEHPLLIRLSEGGELVREFMGEDFERLRSYVRGLVTQSVRGREPPAIVADDEVRREFQAELSGWAASYSAPAWKRDPKNLIKLGSFLRHRLPAAPSEG